MSRQPISISELTTQIRELGVTAGGVILVHTSFSKVGPVEKGPLGLIRALQAALGPSGTLVMPSMTDDDEHPFDPRKDTLPRDGSGGRHVLANAERPT